MKRKKVLSISLCFCFLFCLLPFCPVAAAEEITLIACSDFQSPDYAIGGRKQVTAILDAMVADGITQADGFFCCGDYSIEVGQPNDIKVLTRAVNQIVDKDGHMLFTKGNHDEVGLEELSPSGNNDPTSGAYGAYIIHENDYPWLYNNEYTVSRTAAKLKTYLDEKVQAGFDKPVFILSHVPLHYSRRTQNQNCGSCNGNLLFDVINEAAGKGLNIIFLFGHNHSNGYDDYLGGSAIYLKKGDSINIAQCSTTVYKTETLNFTYMNAGYVGYYGSLYPGAGTDLTMTVFKISGNEVTISRYSATGLHDLKSKGVDDPNANLDGNPAVYASPRKVNATDDVAVAVSKPTTSTAATTATTREETITTTAMATTAAEISTTTAGETTGTEGLPTDTLSATDTTAATQTNSSSIWAETTAITTVATTMPATDDDASSDNIAPIWWILLGGVLLIGAGTGTVLVLRHRSRK